MVYFDKPHFSLGAPSSQNPQMDDSWGVTKSLGCGNTLISHYWILVMHPILREMEKMPKIVLKNVMAPPFGESS